MNSPRLPISPGRPAVAICCLSVVCGGRPCDRQLSPVCSLYAALWCLCRGGGAQGERTKGLPAPGLLALLIVHEGRTSPSACMR